MKIRPLPSHVESLLRQYSASPRLLAHLLLVHEVACVLIEQLHTRWPQLVYDMDAVRLGAATHDIGKVVCPDELSARGHAHEQAGYQLLREEGWPEPLARFTITHARKHIPPDEIADVLVALADTIWKGKREDRLEQALVDMIVMQFGEEPWQVWLCLDDILGDIAAAADERLVWQANYPSDKTLC